MAFSDIFVSLIFSGALVCTWLIFQINLLTWLILQISENRSKTFSNVKIQYSMLTT